MKTEEKSSLGLVGFGIVVMGLFVAPWATHAADAAAGEKVAQRCAMCHTFKEGEPKRVGPNLWNIVNEVHAHKPDFAYSEAMKALHDKKWTDADLDAYLANPAKAIPGNKMVFAGIPSAEDRANLIAWLHTMAKK